MSATVTRAVRSTSLFAAALFVVTGCVVPGDGGRSAPAGCLSLPAADGSEVLRSTDRPIGGYSGLQLENAAVIIQTGEALGLPDRGQAVGVMTAIGESGLRVLDYGDSVGPDSRGLFQQRDNGAWGTYEDRMDPERSATAFFRALQQVDRWQELAPTEAAHRVQNNADPNHYARFWEEALVLTAALKGASPAPCPRT